jgi:hypothetical protein
MPEVVVPLGPRSHLTLPLGPQWLGWSMHMAIPQMGRI